MDHHQPLSIYYNFTFFLFLFQFNGNRLIEPFVKLLEVPSDSYFSIDIVFSGWFLIVVKVEVKGLADKDGNMQFFLKINIIETKQIHGKNAITFLLLMDV